MDVECIEELRLGPVFGHDTARPLANSEALHLLNQVQDTRKQADSTYVPIPLLQQVRNYLERFNTVKSMQAAEAMRESMHEANVKPFEACTIINLMPGSAEEAKALIPSLEAVESRFVEDEPLQVVLDCIATYKQV